MLPDLLAVDCWTLVSLFVQSDHCSALGIPCQTPGTVASETTCPACLQSNPAAGGEAVKPASKRFRVQCRERQREVGEEDSVDTLLLPRVEAWNRNADRSP